MRHRVKIKSRTYIFINISVSLDQKNKSTKWRNDQKRQKVSLEIGWENFEPKKI